MAGRKPKKKKKINVRQKRRKNPNIHKPAHIGGKYPGGHRHIANLPKSTQVPPFRHGSSRSQKGFTVDRMKQREKYINFLKVF